MSLDHWTPGSFLRVPEEHDYSAIKRAAEERRARSHIRKSELAELREIARYSALTIAAGVALYYIFWLLSKVPPR